MNKLYKPTFFRVLTNSTINCILFVFALLFTVELFMPFAEQYMFIMAIMFLITVLLAITVFTIAEHKLTYLELTNDGLKQAMLSSKKRSVFIPYSDIKEVKIESYAVKVYYGDNKKLVLDYYKETNEIKETIERMMKKETSSTKK